MVNRKMAKTLLQRKRKINVRIKSSKMDDICLSAQIIKKTNGCIYSLSLKNGDFLLKRLYSRCQQKSLCI